MRRYLSTFETRILPRGWFDVARQLGLFVGVYVLYQLVRGLIADGNPYKPFGDAMKIINLERTLHVFVEPSVQAWTSGVRWLMDAADWAYLYSHYAVTGAVLIFIYLRRNGAFYFVRNMFMLSMLIALVGYAVFPTAPPALMPEWGFSDAISQFLGVPHVDSGAASAFVNIYAAVPSMHVCFAVMTGWSMSRLVRRRPAKIAWAFYPLWITFVVVATGNHYITDVFLGALTAGVSALLAKQVLARARPDVWAFRQGTVNTNDGPSRGRTHSTGPTAPHPSTA
jgi:membrane-associated phospholipid phosphatase